MVWGEGGDGGVWVGRFEACREGLAGGGGGGRGEGRGG